MLRLKRLQIFLFAMFLVIAMLAAPSAAAPKVKSGGLSGTVYGAAGQALAGATVTAYALPGLQAGCPFGGNQYRAIATTTTDSGGHYKLPLATGRHRIGVTPKAADLAASSFGFYLNPDPEGEPGAPNVTSWVGYADDVMVPTGGRTGLDIHTTTPREITGHFLDGVTDEPMVGIEVRAVQESDAQLARVYPRTFTDATGHYVLGGVPMGVPDPVPATEANEALRYGVVAMDPTAWHGIFIWWHSLYNNDPADPGYNPDDDVPLIDFGDPAETGIRNVHFQYMTLGGRVNGKVVNTSGKPVAGIEVYVDSAFPWPVGVVTDSKGRFVIPAGGPLRFIDPAGKYRQAWYPGVQQQDASPIPDPGPGNEVSITMTLLGDAATITGLVFYSIGEPAAGVDGGAVQCDGTYRSTGHWPGPVTLGFTPPFSDANSEATLIVNAVAGQTTDFGTFYLPTWIIEGNVTNEITGEPVPGAWVELVNYVDWDNGPEIRHWSGWWAPAGGYTDDDGWFRLWIPSTPAGNFNLLVDDHGSDPARFVAEVWDERPYTGDPATFVGDDVTDWDPWDAYGTGYTLFVAPSALEVTVQDGGGNPMPDFAVEALRYEGDEWVSVSGRDTSDAGTAFLSLSPGTYRIRVSAPWGGEEYFEDVSTAWEATDVVVDNLETEHVTVIW